MLAVAGCAAWGAHAHAWHGMAWSSVCVVVTTLSPCACAYIYTYTVLQARTAPHHHMWRRDPRVTTVGYQQPLSTAAAVVVLYDGLQARYVYGNMAVQHLPFSCVAHGVTRRDPPGR